MEGRRLLLLTLLVGFARGFPQGDPDRVIFPGPTEPGSLEVDSRTGTITWERSDFKTPPVNFKSLSCDAYSQLPGLNRFTDSYECFDIASRGPCDPRNWFVLDKEAVGEARGICKRRQCRPGSQEDPRDEVMYKGRCWKTQDYIENPCPEGQWLLVNPFGEGECDCRDEFLPHEARDSLECYQEYLRGPCGLGEQLRWDDRRESTTCAKHRCPGNSVLWDDGKCVSVRDCGRNDLMFVHDGKAQCQIGLREIFIAETVCEDGKSLNHQGKCKRVSGRIRRKGKRRLATRNRALPAFLRQRFGR